MESSVTGFRWVENRFQFLGEAIRYRIFDCLTKRASPVFLCGGDSMATSPFVRGVYEPELVAVLAHLAKTGYSDHFFDIGANIGLSTFYAGRFFAGVDCFEPNPRIFHVLQANLFSFKNTTLHNFGLGALSEKRTLKVPRQNFGGAFVAGPENSYTAAELASKDGFKEVVDSNYESVSVELRCGREDLAQRFAQVLANGKEAGITIKIDVEGFEQVVLKEIAQALPQGLRFAVVFENWSLNFKPRDFVAQHFPVGTSVWKLESTHDAKASSLKKLFQILLFGRQQVFAENPRHWRGMIVVIGKA